MRAEHAGTFPYNPIANACRLAHLLILRFTVEEGSESGRTYRGIVHA